MLFPSLSPSPRNSKLVMCLFAVDFSQTDIFSLSSLTYTQSFYFSCYSNGFITVIIFMILCTKSILKQVTKILSLTRLHSGCLERCKQALTLRLVCLSLHHPILARILLGQFNQNPLLPLFPVSNFPSTNPCPTPSL